MAELVIYIFQKRNTAEKTEALLSSASLTNAMQRTQWTLLTVGNMTGGS